MHHLEPAIRHKRPARVVDTRPIYAMRAAYHDKSRLVAAVNAASRRGEIAPMQERPTFNNEIGRWEIYVREIKPPAPAWHRPVMIFGALAAILGSLAGLGWWVVTTLAAIPLGLFLAGMLFGMILLIRMGRGPSVTINNNVSVR